MAMAMHQRFHDAEHRVFGWFNYERRNWLAIVALAAGIGFSFGQGATNWEWVAKEVAPIQAHDKATSKTLTALQTKVVPQLKAEVGCQKVRGDVAVLAAVGAGVKPDAIPVCPPVQAAAAPGVPAR